MNINNIKKGLCFLLLATGILACNKNDDDSVFDKNPTERLAAQKKELSEALLSSEFGWKAVYFTDEKSFGGFTFLFKFSDDGKVVSASDFADADITPETTEYDIQLRSTTALVFTTKNKIHVLSDGGNSPLESGKGYKGDVQFRYYGRDNDDIVFRTTRSGKEFRFVKATAADWNSLSKNREMMKNITLPTKPLFQSLEITGPGVNKAYGFGYSATTRFANVVNTNIEPINEGNGLGIAFTPTGIRVFPSIFVGEEEIIYLNYNAASQSFISINTGGVKAEVKYLTSPFAPTEDYKIFFGARQNLGFHNDRTELKYAPENSDVFNQLVVNIDTELATSGKTLNRVVFDTNGNNSQIIYRVSSGDITHNVRLTQGAGGTLIFTSGTWSSNSVPESIKALDQALMDPKGFFVKQESYNIKYSNTIYTLTAGSTPIRLQAYLY